MDTATLPAVPKTYISEWIKLDFFNNSNLKTDIQNRISDNTHAVFLDALNNIKGDNKSGYGTPFSEITRLAMAYFYSEIFKDKIKNSYYSLAMVKGFLDGNNLTDYTAIHEIDVTFYKLNNAPLFKHCWLIIQSAWFFNSEYFGHHQHIDYINQYITTGQKLPIEDYNFDQNYLDKKYNDIDTAKTASVPINGFTLVNQWYYGILFLVCKELSLSVEHFNISTIDNREYNPLPKTSRQLRSLTPFKIIECDIKSAFATFLDALTGADLKDHVYNNLMKLKGITRSEAKIMFNTICNSQKYKTKEFTADFFLSCGYSLEHIKMLLYFTHNEHLKFYSFMTRREAKTINSFITQNNLQRGARLHDALIFIDTKTKATDYNLLVQPNCEFGFKELNRPIIKNTFMYGAKWLPYAFINSIPKGLNLITKHENIKPDKLGIANGFKFYKQQFNYVSASFNLNVFFEIQEKDPQQFFIDKCTKMLSTLYYLNNRNLKPYELFVILNHMRQCSNFIFNVKGLYLRLIKHNGCKINIEVKKRKYDIIENLTFAKNIDFLNALNEAKKIVTTQNNSGELYDLLQERLLNNDYSYLSEALILKGRKSNNLLYYTIVRKFNVLCTGLHRTERKRVKSDALYTTIIKNVTLKAVSLKSQQQNAFVQKKIVMYERELKVYNRLINNRPKAQQLFLILCEITGRTPEMDIVKDAEIQNQLKHELIQDILKIELNNIDAGINCFDFEYKPILTNEVPTVSSTENIFDTDLRNSIFNHISIEDANHKGEVFLKEYLKFHKIAEVKESFIPLLKPKEKFNFLKITFLE